MNHQPIFLFYLAGPIDDVSREEAGEWRDELIREAPAGVAFFNPLTAWGAITRLTFPAADAGNRLLIRRCSGLIANLSGPGRAFGTIREIEFARHHGIPVGVVSNPEGLASLLAYDLIEAPSPMDALQQLMQFIVEGNQRPVHPLAKLFGMEDPDDS